jgi:hypothetical protein
MLNVVKLMYKSEGGTELTIDPIYTYHLNKRQKHGEVHYGPGQLLHLLGNNRLRHP